ncbi:hypothetical protein ACYT7O_10805, partial [Streptococcus pyogenes]
GAGAEDEQQQGAAPPLVVNGAEMDDTHNYAREQNNIPVGKIHLEMVFGGHGDADMSVQRKRNKVKEVSNSMIHMVFFYQFL